MNGIIEFFIKKPKIVNIIMIFLLLIGFNNMRNIQKEGFPSVDFGLATISTSFPGASPEEVETNITKLIEDKLIGVDGIDSFSSSSMENYSIIAAYFEQDSDYEKILNEIQKQINQIENFPDRADVPIVTEVRSGKMPTIEIAVTGSAKYNEKRQVAKALEQKLRQLEGVGDVEKLGYFNREIHINVSPEKLAKHYIALSQISQAIRVHNLRIGAGDIKTDIKKKIVFSSEFDELTDVADIIVRSGFEGNQITVSEVAVIEDTFETPEVLLIADGEQMINLSVIKKEKSDIVNLAKDIKSEIALFTERLPDNIKVDIIYDYSTSVRDLINLVVDNALIGLLLVLVILFILLNIKVAFWTAMGIPLSILFGFLFFPHMDVRINFISLMSFIIVLGLLVDDAIVIAENIFSYREKGLGRIEASIKGTKEVMWPVITTIITTIVAFAPLYTMTGVMGEFMWQMPVVVTFVLIGSLVESLFLLPSHISQVNLNMKPSKMKQLITYISEKYEKVVYICMKYAWVTLGSFIVLLVCASVLLITQMNFVLFETDEGEAGFVKFEMKKGTDLATTEKSATYIYDILNPYLDNEIESYLATIGEKNPKIDEMGANTLDESLGNIIIFMASREQRNRSTKVIIDELREKISALNNFEKVIVDNIKEGPPTGRAVTITIVSDNEERRNEAFSQLMSILKQESSVSNIIDSEGIGKNTIEITINQEMIARLKCNSADIAEMIQTIYSGRIVTTVTRNNERIDYRVQFDGDGQGSLQVLESAMILNNEGVLIPLKKLINISETSSISKINHYNGRRSITVYADSDKEIQTTLELNKKIKEQLEPLQKRYNDIEIIWGGEEKATQESMKSLFVAMGLALLGIYFVLVILFNSFSQPFLVMIAIPFTFSGIVYTFYLHHLNFGFMAVIGLIGLAGIVVNDALIMICMLNNCRDNIGTDLNNLSKAARRRFRPILLTTLTTAAGLFPSAYGVAGSNAWLKPMILSIAWGLIFATIITLLLVPAIYKIQLKWFWKEKKLN